VAITDGENGTFNVSMPVQPMGNYGGYGGYPVPMYGGGNFGGCNENDWLILFIILAMTGNWGGFGGFGGGMGAVGAAGMMDSMMLWPWLMTQSVDTDVQGGFNQAATQASITGVQNAVTSGFGDTALGIAGINQNICQTGHNAVAAITGAQNALAQQMYGNQIADLERSFASQTAQMQGMYGIQSQVAQYGSDNRLGIANLGADIAREACADRQAVSEALQNVTAQGVANTNALMNTINGGIQSIKDQICQDKIDAKNDEIAQLRQEVLYARGQASQVAQNSAIVDGIYNRLNACPVGTVPVYGEQPIFTCGGNAPGGCGCGGF
jgi:hypothetical protein